MSLRLALALCERNRLEREAAALWGRQECPEGAGLVYPASGCGFAGALS